MTTDAKPRIKITYATLARRQRGAPRAVRGGRRPGPGRARRRTTATSSAAPGATATATFEDRSPIDGHPSLGHVRDGHRGRRRRRRRGRPRRPARPGPRTPWQERLAILRRAADAHQRAPDGRTRALMAIEVGKNRLEALGEVEEAADLIRYYAQTAEDNAVLRPPDGQPRRRDRPHPLGPAAARRVRGHQPVQLPDGALARARPARALVAGNTVVLKPSTRVAAVGGQAHRGATSTPASRTASSTWSWARARRSARSSRTTPASTASSSPARSRSACGCSTPSAGPSRGRASSRWAARTRRSSRATPTSTRRPRGSCARRSASAARSARPTRGSTSSGRSTTSWSACSSRRPRRSPSATRSSGPNWLGPVINQRAVDRHQNAVAEARRDGTVFIGGERLSDGDLARGFYVEPTVVGGLPASHRLFRDELFVPFTAVARRRLARRGDRPSPTTRSYGLTAGVYSEDQAEVDRFLDRIEAGVVYVNRRAGATTGAWPGIQAFGGWKGSGSTGKAGAGDVLRRAVPARAVPDRRRLSPSTGPRRLDADDSVAAGSLRREQRGVGRPEERPAVGLVAEA